MRALPIVRVHGKFIRQRLSWTPERWDEGYIDKRGYFWVYRPDCPRAYRNGYVKRYHAVLWLNGFSVPTDKDVHHKNKDRLDDRLENLEVIDRSSHAKEHHPQVHVERVCEMCRSSFLIRKWRISSGKAGRFCSLGCYRKHIPGVNAPNAKLSLEEVREIRRLHDSGVKQKEIAGRFGVNRCTILRITSRTCHVKE